MRQLSLSDLDEHNLRQRRYYEGPAKPHMIPADSPYLRRHVDAMLRFAGISPHEQVLEVGCGMGRYTLILAQQGVRVEGLDLTPVLLDRLRTFDDGRYNIPLYCADIVQNPPELHGRFDAVIGFFTLHHLHDLTLCFKAMAHLLKPGGRIVFLEPNPYNPLYYIQMLITPGMTWTGDRGLVKMRKNVIFDAMQKAGLGDLQLTRFGFFPPFISNQNWGTRLESVLERVPFWRALLPFQLFKGIKPRNE